MIVVDDILSRVATHFGVSVEAVRGPSRTAQISEARQAAMWLLSEQGLKLQAIAAHLGRRDHTTVIWGIAQVRARGHAYTRELQEMLGTKHAPASVVFHVSGWGI
jgi:chromosomal replication initiator protein